MKNKPINLWFYNISLARGFDGWAHKFRNIFARFMLAIIASKALFSALKKLSEKAEKKKFRFPWTAQKLNERAGCGNKLQYKVYEGCINPSRAAPETQETWVYMS